MMKQFDAHSPSKIEKIYSVRAMKIMLNQGRIGVQNANELYVSQSLIALFCLLFQSGHIVNNC